MALRTLPHRVIGNFDKLGRAAARKQRNPERHRAEARENGSDADLERSRTLIIGAAFMDVISTAMIFTWIRRADDREKFGGALMKLPGHDNLP